MSIKIDAGLTYFRQVNKIETIVKPEAIENKASEKIKSDEEPAAIKRCDLFEKMSNDYVLPKISEKTFERLTKIDAEATYKPVYESNKPKLTFDSFTSSGKTSMKPSVPNKPPTVSQTRSPNYVVGKIGEKALSTLNAMEGTMPSATPKAKQPPAILQIVQEPSLSETEESTDGFLNADPMDELIRSLIADADLLEAVLNMTPTPDNKDDPMLPLIRGFIKILQKLW